MFFPQLKVSPENQKKETSPQSFGQRVKAHNEHNDLNGIDSRHVGFALKIALYCA